ncbi:uncharacterized protein LOC134293149 [Anolis carolinensis]|uniref:uncharacterized protein LOC134293149 n=1 Tax=Anolis carolinensis TaxID=28377 RepID=UPI002F2B267C
MGVYYFGCLGSPNCSRRLCLGVRRAPAHRANPPIQPLSGNSRRNRHPPCQRGYSAFSIGTGPSKLFLQVLHGPEEGRGAPPHFGLACAQYVHTPDKIQDGIHRFHSPYASTRGLLCLHRFTRRLFPRGDSGKPQALPLLQSPRPNLPVHRFTLRPRHSPKGFYQSRRCRGCPPQTPRNHSLSISGRLASGRARPCLPSSSRRRHPHSPRLSRSPIESRQISLCPVEQDPLHRRPVRLTLLNCLPPARQVSRPLTSSLSLRNQPEDSSPVHSSTPGSHGLHSPYDPVRQAPSSHSAALVHRCLQTIPSPQPEVSLHSAPCSSVAPLVEVPLQRLQGTPVSPAFSFDHRDHGLLQLRLGSSPGQSHRTRPLVSLRKGQSHKLSRTSCHLQSSESLLPPDLPEVCPRSIRQHSGSLLHQQAGWHGFEEAHAPFLSTVVLVHKSQCADPGSPPSRDPKRPGGRSQQDDEFLPRVDARSRDSSLSLPKLGIPHSRPFCLSPECATTSLRRETSPSFLPGLSGGRLPSELVVGTDLPLSAVPPDTEGPPEAPVNFDVGYPNSTSLASTALVSGSSPPLQNELSHSTSPTTPLVDGKRPDPAPGSSLSTSHCLENSRLASLPQSLQEILQAAHKPATTRSYTYKISRFRAFLRSRDIDVFPTSVPIVLDFLMTLVDQKLSLSSMKSYLAALSWCFQQHGRPSLFSDHLVKTFLKGYNNIRPPSQPPTPGWNLELVLSQLTFPPFEPLASTDLRLLSWKVAFLVAITSARRPSELAALRVDEPYLRFHHDRAVLRPDITFLPKVVSAFHLNQDIVLPAFFPNPSSPLERRMHLLDVRRALLFYRDRTKDIRKTQRLFVAHAPDKLGNPISSQRLSHWIAQAIELAYELAKRPPPPSVRPRSTRGLSTSTAFLRGISLDSICKAAIWSNPLTFVSHYRMDQKTLKDSAFARSVLSSCLS